MQQRLWQSRLHSSQLMAKDKGIPLCEVYRLRRPLVLYHLLNEADWRLSDEMRVTRSKVEGENPPD
jgi:hypothetical protein